MSLVVCILYAHLSYHLGSLVTRGLEQISEAYDQDYEEEPGWTNGRPRGLSRGYAGELHLYPPVQG